MQEKATDELDKILANVRPEQINTYYKNNRQYMEEGKKAFYYYMKDVLESKNILLKRQL